MVTPKEAGLDLRERNPLSPVTPVSDTTSGCEPAGKSLDALHPLPQAEDGEGPTEGEPCALKVCAADAERMSKYVGKRVEVEAKLVVIRHRGGMGAPAFTELRLTRARRVR